MIRAGELKHRLRVQQETRADDGGGGATITFTDLCVIWGDVKSTGVRALYEARKTNPQLSHAVRLRYRTGLTPDLRFVYNGAALRIDSIVDPDGRREELLALCEELVQ